MKKGAGVFRASNNPTRQQMIRLITEKGKIKATDINKHLKLNQAASSSHLRVLREARLLNAERMGREILYSINDVRFKEVERVTKELVLLVPQAASCFFCGCSI